MDPLLSALLNNYSAHTSSIEQINIETVQNRARSEAIRELCKAIRTRGSYNPPSRDESEQVLLPPSLPISQPLPTPAFPSPSVTPEVERLSERVSMTPPHQKEEIDAMFPIHRPKESHPKERHPKALPKPKRPREEVPKRPVQSTPEEYWDIH